MACVQMQIWVYGNSFESFLVAIINPKQQAVEHWAEQNGLSGDFNALCGNIKIKQYILGELAKVGKEKKVFFSVLILVEFTTSVQCKYFMMLCTLSYAPESAYQTLNFPNISI